MHTRRKFINQLSIGAIAGLLAPRISGSGFLNMNVPPLVDGNIGLQLYTVSDLMTKDPKGTLQKIAAIGYKEIETAGIYNYKPKDFSSLLKGMGLHWRSCHTTGAPLEKDKIIEQIRAYNGTDTAKANKMIAQILAMPPMNNLKFNSQQIVDEAAEGGVEYVVCSNIAVSTLDEIKAATEIFNKAGELCKKAGLQFAFHNHVEEFNDVNGIRPIDYILENTDKDLVKMELDLCWATRAGIDIPAFFKTHPKRFPLWHAKDLDGVKKMPTEVGAGVVDFKTIFSHAADAGMKHFFVEQDQPPQPLKNIQNSFTYLKKLVVK